MSKICLFLIASATVQCASAVSSAAPDKANSDVAVCMKNESQPCLYPRATGSGIMELKFILDVPVLLMVCVIGLVGNTLSYLVMRKETRPTCSSLCLKILAVVDNMVVLSYVVYFSFRSIYRHTGHMDWWNDFFHVMESKLWLLLWFSKTASVYIVVFVTKQRCIAVCLPLRAPKYCTVRVTWTSIIVIFVFSFVYNLPKAFISEPLYKCDPCTGFIRPNSEKTPRYFTDFYYVYLTHVYFIVMFIYPLTVLFVLNFLLIRSIKKANKVRVAMSAGVQPSTDDVTLKIIGIVISFIILETPPIVLNVVHILDGYRNEVLKMMMMSSYILSAVNSCVNFYIYCLVGKKFRRSLVRLFTTGGEDGNKTEAGGTKLTTLS